MDEGSQKEKITYPIEFQQHLQKRHGEINAKSLETMILLILSYWIRAPGPILELDALLPSNEYSGARSETQRSAGVPSEIHSERSNVSKFIICCNNAEYI